MGDTRWYLDRSLATKPRTRVPVTPPCGNDDRVCRQQAAAAEETTTDSTLARVRQCVRAYRCGPCTAPRFVLPSGNDNNNNDDAAVVASRCPNENRIYYNL